MNIIGIDPGLNVGITIMKGGHTPVICAGKIVTPNDKAIDVRNFMRCLLEYYDVNKALVIIEGASYGDKFRQVELETIRCSLKFACVDAGLEVEIVPPKTARKYVLGNGNSRGQDLLPEINSNGADSLVLAMYGAVDWEV